MMPNLADRLEDIPGVASVTVDLTDEGGGINIRLTPGADESEVMERLRTVLIGYGVRSPGPEPEAEEPAVATHPLGVQVTITPLEHGARVVAESKSVRSFRLVAANPHAIAQGVADAWCQVIGRVPVEIIGVRVGEGGALMVTTWDGDRENMGAANVEIGWESALTLAVGRAIGAVTSTTATPA